MALQLPSDGLTLRYRCTTNHTHFMYHKAFASACLLLASFQVHAQKLKKADKAAISNLQSHVSFLADDKLEGRRAGSNGEKLAREYIAAQFRAIGLLPKGDNNSYFQAFDINEGLEPAKTSMLIINGEEIKPVDYFAFTGSPEKLIEAAPAIALQEQGVPWFLDLKDDIDSNSNNPHFDIRTFLMNEAREAHKKGATAFIVYNSGTKPDGLAFDGKEKNVLPIPVFFVSNRISKKFFHDDGATVDIKLRAAFAEKKRVGNNVVGYIDKKAPHTVIIGAHYDHLGYGEDNNTLDRSEGRKIHNGADDNASGTAAVLELARMLKAGPAKKNNYLFIAFSGEELGLFGSKYFTANPTIDLSSANYMINMDMVGRLNDSTKALSIGGYGTSPSWSSIFTSIGAKNTPFVNKYDSSGSGPSDHTSFYLKGIPVLFFFTGAHNDYHRATDDADKIDYTSEYRIVQYIYALIQKAEPLGKLAFLKTRDVQAGGTRFAVSLGILPDYTYTGEGLRADAVTAGRPAQKAGLQAGDIILKLGEHNVNSMDAYMQALGKFKKGDKTTVRYKRGNDTKETTVEF